MQDTARAAYAYTQEEERLVHEAVEEQFGAVGRVLREVVTPGAPHSEAFRVDLCAVAPTPTRPYYTIVTCGMGAREMPVPREQRSQSRAELVFMLPEGWDIDSRDERFYWPLRWLKLLARLPWEEDSWLGWGHTVPNGEPFADNTQFSSILLLDAYTGGGTQEVFRLPNEQSVQFYQCFPLYDEELDFQLEHGVQALLERLTQANAFSPVLDLDRANLFPAALRIPQERQGPKRRPRPLPDEGCLATDRILKDGAPVGYCYREEPAGDWDSGWRFTAGDESDGYMDDPRHSDVYTLSRIADADADILPILETPAPCAFARGERGLERLKNIK